ncbi:MAG: LamG-like jellyroll fold domain-containing protein, partial [Candidatus Thorarchaeota archaeon]
MSSRENPSAVWDSNYKGVWHLSENPTGTIYDSTSNNHDGTAQGSMISTDQIEGQIDGSLDFEGNDEYIDFGNPIGLQITGSITVEAWFNADYFGNTYLISKNGPSGQRCWDLSFDPINSTHGYAIYRYALNGDKHADDVGNVTVVINQWYHIVGVYNPSTYSRFFMNGQLVDENVTNIVSSQYDAPNNLRFGTRGDPTPPNYFNGTIDEVRISNIARSAGWIKTEYNNQYKPRSFYSIGKEYTISGIPPNEKYFKYYKEIIISHSMISGLHDLYNFPTLISIFDDDLHDKTQIDGDDISFAYNGAWLDHEIELFNQNYNSTHSQLITWISIPRLSPSLDIIIRMYYGNSTIGSQENREAVWDNCYRGVWHLSEVSGNSKDSTYYGTEGVPTSGVTQGVSGLIGNGYDFDGISGTRLDYGDPIDNHLDVGTSSFTISIWVNFDQNTGSFQMPLYKGGTSNGNEGYALEINNGLSSAFYVSNGTQASAVGWAPITLDSWTFLVGVVNRTSGKMSIYKDGSFINNANVVSGDLSSDENLKVSNNFYPVDGIIDEPRICVVARSSDWIATEYNNQYQPQSFLTVGPEESFDTTPPTYSNLIESSDPLELGDTEVITINVSDPSGINQVRIEFLDANHSMTNIGGDTWQYNSWTPSSVGNYSYDIWMEDNCNNWNSTMGTIKVIDTTPPTYSDLIESADPLQLGQNETITIKVYDSPGSGVNQVLLEYNNLNHSMNLISGKWVWGKWKPETIEIHPYKIYMQDNEDNWNVTSGTIKVISTNGPMIENLTESENPLELGNIITINVDVFDNDSLSWDVFIEFEGENYTMINVGGNTYEYSWTRSYVGLVYYTIYTNDSDNNWNSYSGSFDIVDTVVPMIENLTKSEIPLELGNTIIISVNSTDLSGISQVKIEFSSTNHTMTKIGIDLWQYTSWTPFTTGNYSFTIWAEDNNNNWGYISDSILVRDTILPTYSDLTESANIVELGDFLIISINSTDLAGIKDVKIEFENSNHTMTHIDGDLWQYNSWVPNSIGNYTYTIYITDNNDNLNYAVSSILFQDTTLPVYSNFFESTDPLELGDNPIIRIDVHDFAGINLTFLEFEGENHTMTNIYGDTWQYDSWTPNDWIIYQYRIHMEDKSGNWNYFITNITVQDTIPPSPPAFTNSPSGDVSGTIVFDWFDGSDPSGISYYILIIDNEEDPFATPGFVLLFNITNTGPESSYCILPQNISHGDYFYFLAQIDGVGHQSSYTIGAFTVITGSPWNNPFLIIGIILASVIGSLTAIVLVRRKLKKNIIPVLEKIPFKIISSHLNRLSSTQFTLRPEKTEEITDEKDIEEKISEIKYLGEELFAEGAYLEAQEQFKVGRDLLINLGREEEAKLFSELIFSIEGLIEEREKRIEDLERLKNEGEAVKIFETFHVVIKISKRLRDSDTASFYQSELIQFFQINIFKLVDLEEYRSILEEKADS